MITKDGWGRRKEKWRRKTEGDREDKKTKKRMCLYVNNGKKLQAHGELSVGGYDEDKRSLGVGNWKRNEDEGGNGNKSQNSQ